MDEAASRRIVITGATGFIGRRLVLALQRRGHSIVALVRDRSAAASLLGAGTKLVDIAHEAAVDNAIANTDGVVNLAGEPIAQRFTAAAKRRMTQGRVDVTRRLVAAMRRAKHRPSVFVSASATGYYGDRGDVRLTDDCRPGRDFAAQLCVAWEAEAAAARRLGVRTAIARIGVVLGEDGGAVASLAPLIRLRLGAVLGSGAQFIPIIHIDDLVRLLATAIEDVRYDGVFNATAPEPPTHRALIHALSARLGRRGPWLRIPAFVVRALAGEAGALVLGSQRAVPAYAEARGFRFGYPDVTRCVDALFEHEGVTLGRAGALPKSRYLAGQRPRYVLHAQTVVATPIEEVFDFFGRPENLGAMTPSSMRFQITETSGHQTQLGSAFRYRIRLRGVPIGWSTRIEAFAPPERFVDTQSAGPYRYWHHEHRFEDLGDGRTRCVDTVHYVPRFGSAGRLAHWLFVRRDLRAIFGFRRRAMHTRFGSPPALSIVRHETRSVA